MPLPHHKTCKRYDIPGQAHCLTFSCFARQPFFTRERTCTWMLEAMDRGRQRGLFHLWAYVIMPEHVHVVLLPGGQIRISQILSTIKQSLSKRALLWVRKNAPEFLPRMEDRQPNGDVSYRFWQRGGGYDRNLRSARDVHEKIAYIHANPVRRGLVEHPGDWAWSSYRSWMSETDEPIPIDRESLPGPEA